MAWGKEWTTPVFIPKPEWLDDVTDIKQKVYNNLLPTHDPHTNPNAHIYYQCACGAILDPGVKRFASLNNAAMDAGWKVRMLETGYQAYCVKCGEDVE